MNDDQRTRNDGFVARGGLWVVAQFVLFAVYTGLLIAVPDRAAWLDHPVAVLLGALVTAFGLYLGVAGMWQLARHTRVSVFPEPTGGELVTTGIYARVRHPIYGGVALGSVGLALLDANPWALVVGLLLAPFFVAKSRFEERRLEARHPEYAAYRDRVRHRIIPRVW